MQGRVGFRQSRRKRVPWLLKLSMTFCLLLCAMLVGADFLLRGFIHSKQALREADYNRVISAHPLQHREVIEREARKYNLEPAFVAAVIMSESSFRRDAESSVGARGLMQLMPDTAKWIAGKLNEDGNFSFERMFDPETNIRYGAWYLGYLAERFRGEPVLVAGAYHAGQGEIQNWINEGRSTLDTMVDGPTKRYAEKVVTSYGVYERLYFAPDAELTNSGTAD